MRPIQPWSPSPYRPGMGLDPPYLGDREPQLRRFREFVAEREFSDADAAPDVFARLILSDLFDVVRKLSRSKRVRDTAYAAAERVLNLVGSIRVSYGGCRSRLSPRTDGSYGTSPR